MTDQESKEEVDSKDDSVTPVWYIQENRARILSDQFKQLAVMMLVYFFMGLCIVFFFVCPNCLFGILIASVILCPFFNQFNISLWMAIILLAFSGWSFSVGRFKITWET